MKSPGRGQGCIHIGTSVALLTFTAWLVILKEDGVVLCAMPCKPGGLGWESEESLLEGEWQRDICRIASTPNLLSALVTNK